MTHRGADLHNELNLEMADTPQGLVGTWRYPAAYGREGGLVDVYLDLQGTFTTTLLPDNRRSEMLGGQDALQVDGLLAMFEAHKTS